MNKILILAMMFFALHANTQVLEEEIGFRLVKAEYLLGTERFEDAIKELNEVIKQNPNYKNAMLLRAETKYRLAAYKGAKQDALEHINANGVTAKACSILGKAEYALASEDAAFNNITAAIALGEKDAKLYEIRAEIYENRNQKISACEDWQAAAKLGSTKGAINAKKNCGMKDTPPQIEPEHTNTNPSESDSDPTTNINIDTTQLQDGEVLSEGQRDTVQNNPTNTTSNDTTIVAANTDNANNGELIPEEDDTVNEIFIDEELTLEIFGQGLGKRRIMERPSILILAEKDGIVTVEICVNNEGRIDYAEFVPSKSTISQNSLVSLAIRKSKEFWFEESEYPKQCGYVRFKIKGS
jgi:tetratricopeptide (TPR) repeat protein